MDGNQRKEKPKNPREGASLPSILTFWYTLPLFKLGYNRDLNENDLYEPLNEHTSHQLGEKIARLWEEECQRIKKKNDLNKRKNVEHHYKPSLLRVLLKIFGFKLMLYGIFLALMETLLNLSQPLLLSKLLKYFVKDTKVTTQQAYIYASLIILCSLLYTFMIHSYMIASLHLGMKMRIACCSLIYRKSLKLSYNALNSVGQGVNLLSNDVSRFDLVMSHLHYIWISPLQTIIIMYLMYQYVQESAVIGMMVLVMFVSLQGLLAGKLSSLRKKTAFKTDERVRLTNEMINGIQTIKMNTWEEHFVKLISLARLKELHFIRGVSYIRGTITSFFMTSTRLTLCATILSFILYGSKINAEIVFVITAYFDILRSTMTAYFSLGITFLLELMVSIRRIQNFMLYEEVSTKTDSRIIHHKTKSRNSLERNPTATFTIRYNDFNVINESNYGKIKLNHASAKWLPNVENDTLSNIDIDIKPGELIAIVGQVGAGKSSLINVILKELPLSSGVIQVNGQIAYASQEPWLFASSVRQNILFGRKMNQYKYDEVISVCQLERDFELLPRGDKTIVGHRGVRLSGGQRARINLARAVYSEASIYAFDDPLSAIDTRVGKHIFEECICKYLKHKTRILVTHQLQYLNFVDKIIVLENGSIHAQGSFDELVKNNVDFITFLENNDQKPQSENYDLEPSSHKISGKNYSTNFCNKFSHDKNDTSDQKPKEEEETRCSGTVSIEVYKAYFKNAGSISTIFFVAVLFLLSQFLTSASDYFIYEWSKVEENSVIYANDSYTTTNGWKESLTRYEWIYIYSAIAVLTIIVTLVRSAIFFNACVQASRRLHDHMLSSISRALMYFFNVNGSGRILNRFSKDLGQVDEPFPMAFIDLLQYGLNLIGIFVVVTILNPWLIIPSVIVFPIIWWLRVIYMRTSRSVKRLEGTTRSPIFDHLTSSLQGLSTIRAFDADQILINEFDQHQDLHSSAWFNFLSTTRAFSVYLEILCIIYTAIVTVSFFISWSQNDVEEKPHKASVGLAITQSISLIRIFQWTLRQSSEVENYMTSVERILEYCCLPSEPTLKSSAEKRPKDNWPYEGRIEFRNISLCYSPSSPSVLRNLNFTIQSHEKIGVVGRTGAGKSSLIQSLFRLADIQGVIEIDGIDTKEIGLHDLRRNISIIPQEPFLFSGNLRRNLDPFNQSGDPILLQALKEVELKEMGLDDSVSEGGSNLSVGQRQLVCLARAIVKNNPILVLDEATANVDPKTDELIQKTIRTKFKNCTVLTIAHRLNTVMDSDRILVMDAGTVVEFDNPYDLLQKESGYFKSMVNETGSIIAETLMKVAENAYKNKYTN